MDNTATQVKVEAAQEARNADVPGAQSSGVNIAMIEGLLLAREGFIAAGQFGLADVTAAILNTMCIEGSTGDHGPKNLLVKAVHDAELDCGDYKAAVNKSLEKDNDHDPFLPMFGRDYKGG